MTVVLAVLYCKLLFEFGGKHTGWVTASIFQMHLCMFGSHAWGFQGKVTQSIASDLSLPGSCPCDTKWGSNALRVCVQSQVLFQHGKLQWARLENLVKLAQEGSGGLDLSDTVRDGARVVLMDDDLRRQLLLALTEDDRLHLEVGVRA